LWTDEQQQPVALRVLERIGVFLGDRSPVGEDVEEPANVDFGLVGAPRGPGVDIELRERVALRGSRRSCAEEPAFVSERQGVFEGRRRLFDGGSR
jgi:hypothetical protein